MVITVFPSWPLPLSPLRHHGAGFSVVVQTVPTTRCFPTSDGERDRVVIKKRYYYTVSLSGQLSSLTSLLNKCFKLSTSHYNQIKTRVEFKLSLALSS